MGNDSGSEKGWDEIKRSSGGEITVTNLAATLMWDLREREATNLDNQKDGSEKMYTGVGASDEEEDGLHSGHGEFGV